MFAHRDRGGQGSAGAGWQSAESGVAYKATADAGTNSSALFGITISYMPKSGQPALPNSMPMSLTRGGIVIT